MTAQNKELWQEIKAVLNATKRKRHGILLSTK